MEKEPVISVVIPAYNAGPFVADAISSVHAHGIPGIEIIVVNDGSTDNTGAVLSSIPGITVLSQPNRGQAAARNAGIKAAQGKYVALLDADDLWVAGRSAAMLSHLADGSGYDYVRGMIRHARNIGTNQEEISEPMFMDPLVGACLYRREVFSAVGLFDESMRQGEDFDWNIRLVEAGCRELRLREAVLLYRRHGSNLTNNADFRSGGQAYALRKKIERMKKNSKIHA